jgi:hypothetical protein
MAGAVDLSFSNSTCLEARAQRYGQRVVECH